MHPYEIPIAHRRPYPEAGAGAGELLAEQAKRMERRMLRAIVDHKVLYVRAHSKPEIFDHHHERTGAAEELFVAADDLRLPWRGAHRMEKIATRVLKGRVNGARREAEELLRRPPSQGADPEFLLALGSARDVLEEAPKVLAYLELGWVEEPAYR